MTESKNEIIFEIEQSLSKNLTENLKQETKQEPIQIPFIKKESNEIEKKRIIRRWKKTEGYFYLHPDKFRFGFKDL